MPSDVSPRASFAAFAAGLAALFAAAILCGVLRHLGLYLP
jgi:hypothetical protein